MTNRRKKPDGLPFRVYERRGVRDYSIGYKGKDGKWAFRLRCAAGDSPKIAELRREAITKAATMGAPPVADGSFAALADDWWDWQQALPMSSPKRRSETTLAENKRELVMLKKGFGHMDVTTMEKGDAYDYLDACLQAVDKLGDPRPRPAKGNKEIALARLVLEWGVRRRRLKTNPFMGVEPLATEKSDRLVTDQELALAVEVGRRMGGPQHIVAMALRTAWLCVRRSVEVRALTRDQIGDEGIRWVAAKRQTGQATKIGLIEWSAELRATIDETLAIKRYKVAGTWYLFGNMSGQRYTKGGWKATLAKLMDECVAEAERRRIDFQKFSLQDCRPKGVTDKIAQGDEDTVDATLHSSERMVRTVYDRRRIRVAKPTR